GVNLGLVHPVDWLGGATMDHRLSWKSMDSSRSADSSIWKAWRYSSEKNWGVKTGTNATGWASNEGGFGNVDQEQKNIDYKGKLKWDPVTFLGATHAFQAGLELGQQRSSYVRHTQYEQYQASVNINSCAMVGGGVDTRPVPGAAHHLLRRLLRAEQQDARRPPAGRHQGRRRTPAPGRALR
ncbi:MAG: hypothetical protein RR376_27800, partial [Janthinobacterium sp.]